MIRNQQPTRRRQQRFKQRMILQVFRGQCQFMIRRTCIQNGNIYICAFIVQICIRKRLFQLIELIRWAVPFQEGHRQCTRTARGAALRSDTHNPIGRDIHDTQLSELLSLQAVTELRDTFERGAWIFKSLLKLAL